MLRANVPAVIATSESINDAMAMDLLAYHTTPLGTGQPRRQDALEARYAHRREAVLPMIQQCKDLYLLVRASQGGQDKETALAHDTLAALVQRRFRASDRPGQRARRILESRAEDWSDGRTGAVLDAADLETIERGGSGMRGWTEDERRLIDASRQARARRRRGRRIGQAGAVLALVLIVVSAGYAWRQQGIARQEAQKAAQVKEFVVSMFEEADPAESKGADITAKEILDEGAARIDRELAGQPAVRAEMLTVVGNVYRELGVYDAAQGLLQRSLAVRDSLYDRDHPDVAESLNDLGVLLHTQGIYDQADSLLREALALRRKRHGDEHEEEALTLTNLALVLRDNGAYDEADSLFRHALATQRRLLGETHPDIAKTPDNLANTLRFKGDYDKAEALLRQALAM